MSKLLKVVLSKLHTETEKGRARIREAAAKHGPSASETMLEVNMNLGVCRAIDIIKTEMRKAGAA